MSGFSRGSELARRPRCECPIGASSEKMEVPLSPKWRGEQVLMRVSLTPTERLINDRAEYNPRRTDGCIADGGLRHSENPNPGRPQWRTL
jgi:hypothetical protein